MAPASPGDAGLACIDLLEAGSHQLPYPPRSQPGSNIGARTTRNRLPELPIGGHLAHVVRRVIDVGLGPDKRIRARKGYGWHYALSEDGQAREFRELRDRSTQVLP